MMDLLIDESITKDDYNKKLTFVLHKSLNVVFELAGCPTWRMVVEYV